MATETGCEWYGHCFCIFIPAKPLCESSILSAEASVLCCKCGWREARYPGLTGPYVQHPTLHQTPFLG